MGILTGKFDRDTTFPADDIRSDWNASRGAFERRIRQLDALRDALTSGGRTLAQGALAWIWARNGRVVPIPGFRSEKQVRENAGAMEKGPLTASELSEVGGILRRLEEETV
jgi:aryl-alcohol dehydrogenase-like predicted oxidoreductase